MVDKAVGAARAAIGQGFGMGWGDEAEAWLRSKLGQGAYEDQLKQIRGELADYHKEAPFTAGAAELAGGFIPGAAMMLVPGAQPAAAAQIGRSGLAALGRLAALGAGSGAISGAGSAEEGGRGAGALGGALLGGAAGAALPVGLRAAGAGKDWLLERLAPTTARASNKAADLLAETVARSKMTPTSLATKLAEDRRMGVPSVLANASQGLANQARGVAKRAGAGSIEIGDTLATQKAGIRERTYDQVKNALHPGDYYADEEMINADLRRRASSLYDQAYAHGEVDDPRIMTVLQHPAFKGFYDKARKIADSEAMAAKLRGEDPTKFQLNDLYELKLDPSTQELTAVVTQLPDVRTLDYMKRGIDATIDSGFRGQGMSTAEAQALKQLRREFVNAIDENVPAYQQARKAYAGDMEVKDAMRMGLEDFDKISHEQMASMVKGMSSAEQEALRTGVARNLYGKIMNPATNRNAAQNIIGSVETQQRLRPLFQSDAHFDLFKNALERESQLFNQANRVLGGADTAENLAIKEQIEGTGQPITDFISQAISGGFLNSMTNLGLKAAGNASMTDKTAKRLSEMLMAKDPTEVATVVKLLEDRAKLTGPQAFRAGATEAGAVTGVTSAGWPAPIPEEVNPDNLTQQRMTRETVPPIQ